MSAKGESKIGTAWFVRGLLKMLALLVGAAVTVVCLMSLIGTQTDNGWIRWGAAIAVAILVPALLADRVLARIAPDKLGGVTTDVMALVYMAFALAFVGVAHGATGPLLAREGARLEHAGRGYTSRLAYALAGHHSVESEPARGPTVVATATRTHAAGDGSNAVTDDAATESGSGASGGSAASTGASGDGGKPANRAERTPAEIFTEYAPAVVTITVKHELRGMLGEGGGTGFVIDGNGTIGTNYHVIDSAADIEVRLMDGTVLEDIEILDTNESKDLALIKVSAKSALPTVVLGDSEKVTVGERAVSIGNPLGLDHTLTDGLVSARRVVSGRKMIQMSVPVSPGNSGGPLFNMRGEVIGVSTAGYFGGQNLNLAMPIDDLKAMIKSDYPDRRKPGKRGKSKTERW